VPNQKIGEAMKPQPKPLVEKKENPQKQIKINNEYDGDVAKKKETRRGRRHSIYNQDAKVMSINQNKKDDLAQLKCYKCDVMGHFASMCPNNLEKKAQANEKRQDNVKQNLGKEKKTQTKRIHVGKMNTWKIHVP
jgi:hypothetical protein